MDALPISPTALILGLALFDIALVVFCSLNRNSSESKQSCHAKADYVDAEYVQIKENKK